MIKNWHRVHRRTGCRIFFDALCVAIFVLPLVATTLVAQQRLLAASELPDAPTPANAPAPATASTDAATGSISGTVEDTTGAVIPGATITLDNVATHTKRVTVSDAQGSFIFTAVDAGTFSLSIQSKGFAPALTPDISLHTGEGYQLPSITLQVTAVASTVRVGPHTQYELAQEQIHAEEKQRLGYIVPNFYVTYLPHPAPLTAKQKFALAARLLVDPYVFIATGVVAGVEQATDTYNGYGQGAAGYGRRYGAAYGDAVSSVIIGAGVLPALLRQDPRYYYKGTGSVRSRIGYALLTIVRIKGDNGRWQPNYSGILGDFASGAISNSYLASSDQEGIVTLTENTLIGFGFRGIGALEQEFALRHLTTHATAPGTVGHP